MDPAELSDYSEWLHDVGEILLESSDSLSPEESCVNSDNYLARLLNEDRDEKTETNPRIIGRITIGKIKYIILPYSRGFIAVNGSERVGLGTTLSNVRKNLQKLKTRQYQPPEQEYPI